MIRRQCRYLLIIVGHATEEKENRGEKENAQWSRQGKRTEELRGAGRGHGGLEDAGHG